MVLPLVAKARLRFSQALTAFGNHSNAHAQLQLACWSHGMDWKVHVAARLCSQKSAAKRVDDARAREDDVWPLEALVCYNGLLQLVCGPMDGETGGHISQHLAFREDA
ncbi:hypothetical protein WJX81_008177 [Elliptochloris bilobata]|uniref:Uncharacterized protein n=1 Tax=Elliptochloris bilobata TaxID=381761 RepID=A0AAW1SE13_9CHLO